MKKKMNNKRGFVVGLILASMLTVVGCGSNEAANMMAQDTAYDMDVNYLKEAEFGYAEEAAMEDYAETTEEAPRDANGNAPDAEVSDNRKLIKRTNLSLETLEFDEFITSLEKLIAEKGGYVEYLDQSNDTYYGSGRYASYTIRIPENQLDMFVDHIGDMASIKNKNESVTDVTLSYVDLESQRDMYEIEQENLLELLDKAETIEDMIVIESRLTEVRYQLQSMESQLRTYDNLVDYATITIYVEEVVRLEPKEEAPAGERIRVGFSNSVAEVFDRAKEFGINFVIALPVIIYNLIILAIFAGIIFLIVKLIIRKSRKRKAKQQEQLEQQRRLQAQWAQRQQEQMQQEANKATGNVAEDKES